MGWAMAGNGTGASCNAQWNNNRTSGPGQVFLLAMVAYFSEYNRIPDQAGAKPVSIFRCSAAARASNTTGPRRSDRPGDRFGQHVVLP
jgi:hypothetical protein